MAECASCRQLAEALRPSDDVLREALSEEECLRLPRYDRAIERHDPWDGRTPQATRAAVRRGQPRLRTIAAAKWASPQMTRGAVFVFFSMFAAFLLIESFVQRWAAAPAAHDSPAAQGASAIAVNDTPRQVALTADVEAALEQLAQSNIAPAPRASRIEFDSRCIYPRDGADVGGARIPLGAVHSSPNAGSVLVDRSAARCCTLCHSSAAGHRSSQAAISASATRCHECHGEVTLSRGS